MADTKQHVQGAEEKMNFAIEYLDEQLSHIRAGKANPRLLDSIKVPYYGAPTPLNNVASVTIPDARTIMITPWEKKIIRDIEKAILDSDLGITPDNILTAPPMSRNVLLAEAVKRIGLAERTGRGIDKIYTAMLRSGHNLPDYSASNNTAVILRLDSAELDKNYIKMIVSEESRLHRMMPLDALIVLSVLKTERRATISMLSLKIQKSLSDTRAIVEWLIELGMAEGVGNGSARRYMLSSKVYSATDNKAGYSRQRGWDIMQEREMILSYLDKFREIDRAGVMDLCRCTGNHASWLLRQMVEDGVIEQCGQSRATHYIKKK